jgi:hypothetical protein
LARIGLLIVAGGLFAYDPTSFPIVLGILVLGAIGLMTARAAAS